MRSRGFVTLYKMDHAFEHTQTIYNSDVPLLPASYPNIREKHLFRRRNPDPYIRWRTGTYSSFIWKL